ncbi:EAL domain-containing protein [Shewanella sp.]|uniref:bifunctional diguanylate cyclase/phosphodiesterase n=1 Tax=Shewanella sp. TaxID=50422 RepID=UPI003A969636
MTSTSKGFMPGISLRFQLHLLIILVALLTFTSSLYLSIQSTQQYLNTQMQSHAQDTATSLGLSISSYLDDPNLVVAKTMVSAIFDSGYYEEIMFTDTKGDVKIHKTNPVEFDEVPHWFVSMFPLTPPSRSTEVNSGWGDGGVLSVQSNPGFAYKALWRTAKRNFLGIAGITLLSLVLIQLITIAVLKPLQKIEHLANEVGKKNFIKLEQLPFTTDLRAVVNAMNTMVANIQRSFASLTKQADELKRKAFQDHLTGLGNRRLMEQRFAAAQQGIVNNETKMHIGLLSLHSLAEVNHQQGYAEADRYILRAVNELTIALANTDSEVFRINGSDIVFLSHAHEKNLQRALDSFNEQIKLLNNQHYQNGFGSVVMMPVDADTPLPHYLSALDQANIQRKQQPNLPVMVSDDQREKPEGRMAWNQLIQQILDTEEFELWAQPVVSNDNAILYIETFVRFKYQQQPLATAETYAMAEEQGLALQLDMKVIRFILQQIIQRPEYPYAINLSLGAVSNKIFGQWLDAQLQALDKHGSIIFELSEHSILKAPEESKALFELIKRNGCQICIERFGASLSTFKYLQGLDVDYVKVDGSYSLAIDSADNLFFIKTLCQICHGLGIPVIAPHIESKEILRNCQSTGVDAVQGNWLSVPQKANILTNKSNLTGNIINLELTNPARF